jgi:hypothetical protein
MNLIVTIKYLLVFNAAQGVSRQNTYNLQIVTMSKQKEKKLQAKRKKQPGIKLQLVITKTRAIFLVFKHEKEISLVCV